MQYDFVITEFEAIPYRDMMAMCNLPVEYDKDQPDIPLSILGRVDNYKDVEVGANFHEEAENLSQYMQEYNHNAASLNNGVNEGL